MQLVFLDDEADFEQQEALQGLAAKQAQKLLGGEDSEAVVNPLGNSLHGEELRQKHAAEAAADQQAQRINAAAVAVEELETFHLWAAHDTEKRAEVEDHVL